MYLEHFHLKTLPFTLTPDIDFFYGFPGHIAALNTLLVALHHGEGFIKITGEVGSGKTMLCRKLLASLDDNFVSAYIPNPDLSPGALRLAFAKEIGLNIEQVNHTADWIDHIHQQLITLHSAGKRIVLIIDEAQALSYESLEALRLMTNLETDTAKLLQIVLLGQPELDQRLNQSRLRQLKQRITFSYCLPLLSWHEVKSYVTHRFAIAGHTGGYPLTLFASLWLWRASGGIPRLINVLCHKALLVAYGRGDYKITCRMLQQAVQDTESVMIYQKSVWRQWLITGVLFVTAILLGLSLANTGLHL